MSIVRWDPFRNIATLQGRINRLFDESFPGETMGGEELGACAWQPNVDIYDTESAIVVKAELPGVDKEDIFAEVKDNVLVLKGERRVDSGVDEGRYYRREICVGTFQRAFSLQTRVDPEKIKARFKTGVLHIEIPKPEQEKPKQVSVDID